MDPKSPRWLDHIAEAGEFIIEMTADATAEQFMADRQLRLAVERSFEIIGEALRRLERSDPPTASRIAGYRFAIDFRNRLVHGYDDIDHLYVWLAIRESLPGLLADVAKLLDEADRDEAT